MQVKLVAASLRELPPSQEKKLSYKQGVFSAECHRGLGGEIFEVRCAECAVAAPSLCLPPASSFWSPFGGGGVRVLMTTGRCAECAEQHRRGTHLERLLQLSCQVQWPKKEDIVRLLLQTPPSPVI